MSAPITPPSLRRRAAPLVVVPLIVLAVAVAVILLAGGPGDEPLASMEAGYLASVTSLRERASIASEGAEPYATAMADLLRFADRALTRDPRPQEPLQILGTEGPFVDDSAASYGLALAYILTGEDAYARQAARYIGAWVATTRTTVGTCPDDGRCQTSLIVSRTAPAFVFAADLLVDHPAFADGDRSAFRAWLRTVILPAASIRSNNWGDAGTFMRMVVTDYLGDEAGFLAAVDRWHIQADRVAADGSLPEETRRGASGLLYTQEALQYRVGGAVVADRRGLDLWAYRGPNGATLRDAINHLAWYWARPEAWPWDSRVEVPSAGPLWEIVYAKFRDPAYVPIILSRRPFGDEGHSALRWTTITNGLPIEADAQP